MSDFDLAKEVHVAPEGEEALDYLYRRRKYAGRVTGNPNQEPDLKESYRLGVNEYVVKQIKFHDLVDVVRSLGVF